MSSVGQLTPRDADARRTVSPNRPINKRPSYQKKGLSAGDVDGVNTQIDKVSKAVRGVPRRTESETKLWEAFEKLSDLSQLQRAQIQHLAKTQGRFQHKPDSKEAKIIEEKFLSLKKKETDSLQARKRDFERLIEEHAETMNNVKTKLLETEKEAREVAHERDDEALQKKHAKEAYAEVKEWLDEAQKSIKGLQDDIQRHERINAALDDTTKDMASKIENYQADVSARDNIIKEETAKSDRARVELGEAQRVLTEEQDNGARLANTIEGQRAEAEAEYARLRLEIAHLQTEVEVLIERTLRWENFDKLCPDYNCLVEQLEAKDEVLHRAKQVVSRKHHDEATLEKKINTFESDVQQRVGTLSEVESTLETILSQDPEADKVGDVCVEKTVVTCYPDPCPVGKDLNLVVTTFGKTGEPVRGVAKEEFKIEQVDFPIAGGSKIGDEMTVEEVLRNDRATSTFTTSYPMLEEGRSGYKVTFRGQTFITTAHVPAPTPLQEDEKEREERKPRFTVTCLPNTVAVGETLDLTVVVREPGTILPARECQLPPEQFRIAPYTTAHGLRIINPIEQIPGTPVYKTTVEVEGITAPGNPRDYIGIEVMQQGGSDAGRGSAKLVADSRNDNEWDANTTTVTCSPDPAAVGEEVTVVVTARNSYYVPLAANAEHPAPSPLFASYGSSTVVEQPTIVEGQSSQVFVGKFTPSEPGRCGVAVDMGGCAIGHSTVHVRRPEPVDPTQTTLNISPSVVAAGETLNITFTTRDATGRPVPGPEPTAFRLTPLGSHAVLLPLRRQTGSEHTYVTTLRTDVEREHTMSGVSVEFEGVSLQKKARVSSEALDVPKEVVPEPKPEPTVPKYSVRFGADPVRPGEVIPVVISANHDEAALDRRRANLRAPRVSANVNGEVGEVEKLPGARYVWTAMVKIGDALGTCAVEAEVEGRTYSASTTVEGNSVEALDRQIDRLKKLETQLRDLVSQQVETRRDLDERAKALDERDADLRAKEEELDARHNTTQDDDVPQHLMFGLHLSDGVQYGYQWDAVDGAKVVEVVEGGPVDVNGDVKILAGDVLREVKYKDVHGYVHTCQVRQMDDFRRIARMLSRQGTVPDVVMTFYQTQFDTMGVVTLKPAASPSPPGRSVGTLRHPSRTIDTSFCASSPGRSSIRSRN